MSERTGEPVRVEGSPTRCPWCKDDIADVKQVVACAACGARHHGSCHGEHGRCASCGATDVLVPRAATAVARQRVVREEPPRGSIIRVSRDSGALVYEWPVNDKAALALGIVFTVLVLTSPLGIALLLAYARARPRRVRIDGDTIEFPGAAMFDKAVVARREEVGAVRVTTAQQVGTLLTIDVGMDRKVVQTGLVAPSLRPPEMEWLAEAIEAWKSEA